MVGHILQNTGSIRSCWTKTRNSMWKAFWANPGSKNAWKLAVQDRMRLLSKAVLPLLDCRCSRWPPQISVAQELDRLHRKMTASVQRAARYPGEDISDYIRRRGRLAGQCCRVSGNWSRRWFNCAVDWNAHLERPRNRYSWSSRLLHYMDRQWFIDRRASLLPANCSSGSCLAGRTDTRTIRGCVHARWHDVVDLAKQRL